MVISSLIVRKVCIHFHSCSCSISCDAVSANVIQSGPEVGLLCPSFEYRDLLAEAVDRGVSITHTLLKLRDHGHMPAGDCGGDDVVTR